MPTPPVAKKQPHTLGTHGQIREDPYFWMRDRDSQEVLDYLKAENEYADAFMAPHAEFVEQLCGEIKERIPQDDEGLPQVGRCGWWYSWRIREGDQYPSYFRTRNGREQVLYDLNEIADLYDYVAMTAYACPVGTDLMWYTLDTTGSGEGHLHLRDLAAQKDVHVPGLACPELSRVVGFALVEGRHDAIWFVTEDEKTKRADSLWFWHVDDERPTLVMHEEDERFCLGVTKTSDRKFFIAGAASHTTDEIWIADAASLEPNLTLLFERRQDVEMDVDHCGNHWWVSTNLAVDGPTHRNYELSCVSDDHPSLDKRRVVLPHREDVLLEDFEIFREHMVVTESVEGVGRICVYDLADGGISGRRQVEFPEELVECGLGANYIVDTHLVRVGYESLTTPGVTYDVDMRTMEMTERKRRKVLGGFDHTAYESWRTYATAPDGTRIPVTVARRKGTRFDGSAPCWLTGYGAYGLSYELDFAATRLSILDRGFVYAIAHVRGGSERGKPWHDAGRMEHKTNTFTDFIACAEHLVARNYAAPEKLCIEGRSAGGLLMGAVVNMRPDLFRVVYAGVPFVDVVTTMLDDTMPLVVAEFEEWGNPAEREDYDRMLAYSPYDNVEAKGYPALLVRTGLNDGAVMYWEPAKWVAKLRATKTDDNPIVFRCHMGAGHGGSSGRFDRYKDAAADLAFVCTQVGITA